MSLLSVASSDDTVRDELLDYQLVFSAFDKQAEGPPNRLTADKLTQILKTQLEIQPTPQQIKDIIAAVDLNDSGDIQFNEFLKLLEKKPVLLEKKIDTEEELEQLQFSREQIKDIFKSVDTDNDGLITLPELRAMFEGLGERHSEEELGAIIRIVDPNNKTNAIGYQAFVRLMMTPVE